MHQAIHPVAEVLLGRRAEGSTPAARRDAHRVALVIEGGGMRGVVSAGMTSALERLGFGDAFDLVVGSSAGALNGAGLLARVAAAGPGVYAGPLASRAFINPARLLIGRPAVDLHFLLTYAATNLGGNGSADADAVARLASLVCVAVDIDTASPVTFADLRTREELWQALMATMRMPLFGGRPVEIGGRRFIDGALAAPVPLDTALELGATHVLVLQTRPHGVPRSTGSRVAERLIERHLRGLNPVLERLWRERADSYEVLMEDIARRSSSPGDAPPHVLGLRPPAGTPVVGQLERRPDVLTTASAAAEALVEAAFSEPDTGDLAISATG